MLIATFCCVRMRRRIRERSPRGPPRASRVVLSAPLSAVLEDTTINDPHPVVLCVTDNISAKNWTVHISKKSIIGRALARFFCGLLIGSEVGINAKWISTLDNKIADKISRIKKSTHNPSSFQYDFSKLQQDHAELKHCRFFQPNQELLSMIWDILLT